MTDPEGMLRYLWVLRHGKAAGNAPAGGGDKERPLTARGRRDATALGHRLAAGVGVFGLADVPLPQVVLCSSAVRTRQTADLVLEAMGGSLPLESLHSLYGANPDTVLGYIRELDDQAHQRHAGRPQPDRCMSWRSSCWRCPGTATVKKPATG